MLVISDEHQLAAAMHQRHEARGLGRLGGLVDEHRLEATGVVVVDGQPIELDALEDRARTALQADPDLALRLKADGDGDATRVVAVMQAL